MVAMMLKPITPSSLKMIGVSIIAIISWLPPLISQLFSPFWKAASFFHSLAVLIKIVKYISSVHGYIHDQNM